jgi:hypothetical protein
MNKIQNTKSSGIVFSKWSRKGYAIFSSLSKVVKIARVSVDISISSFGKNHIILSLFNRDENNTSLKDLFEDESKCLYDLLVMIFPEPGVITIESSCNRKIII